MIKSKIEFDRDKMIAWLNARSGNLEQIRTLLNNDAVKYAMEHKHYSFVYEMAADKYIRHNILSAVLLLAGIDDLLDNIGNMIFIDMFKGLPITILHIPFNIRRITLRAFANNNLLNTVYLPELDALSTLAFEDCDRIKFVYMNDNKDNRNKAFWHAVFPTIDKIEFKDGVMEL